jgi:hypothetical protein
MKNRNFALIVLAAILAFACNLPTPTPATGVTETPTFTPIPILASATATLQGSTVPFASPNDGALNCRTGPATTWQVAAVLGTGQSVEIVGKNTDGSWWYVKNPAATGTFCWVSAAFVNVTGDASGVQVVAVPATPTNNPNSSGAINSIDVFVEPDTIHVGGCIGPIQPIKVFAKIGSSGPVKIKVHFKVEQTGDLSTHNLNFTRADIQDVSDSFTPPVDEGKHKVTLVIEGVNTSSLNATAFYEITC